MSKAERKILLRDVAQHAGVAVSTVSNVFSGNPNVSISDETRQLVLASAQELGFQPRQRSTNTTPIETIGLIVRSQAHPFSKSPFYTQILQGAERACTSNGVTLMYATMDEHASRPEHLPLIVQRRQVQALVVVGYFDQVCYTLLKQIGCPYVLVDHIVPGIETDCIVGDDEEGGYLATCHLLKEGHHHPAMIVGPQAHVSLYGRFKGYQRALAEAGVPYDEAFVSRVANDTTAEEGYDAMRTLLERIPLLTGVFCCNDHTAFGALSLLHDQGIAVPERCSVIGYDDVSSSSYTQPPLTTVRIDQDALGIQAVWALLERVERPQLPPRQIRLGITLIKRRSTGSVPSIIADDEALSTMNEESLTAANGKVTP